MNFGWLLDRIWIDFGCQVGAKLALKSVQEGVKTDVKKGKRFLRPCRGILVVSGVQVGGQKFGNEVPHGDFSGFWSAPGGRGEQY